MKACLDHSLTIHSLRHSCSSHLLEMGENIPKWNPIEHMLFSQISRVWSGAVFNTVEEACELASRARTKTELAVFTSINRRIYETKKERNPLFESECEKYIVKDEILPKWNYLVKCN